MISVLATQRFPKYRKCHIWKKKRIQHHLSCVFLGLKFINQDHLGCFLKDKQNEWPNVWSSYDNCMYWMKCAGRAASNLSIWITKTIKNNPINSPPFSPWPCIFWLNVLIKQEWWFAMQVCFPCVFKGCQLLFWCCCCCFSQNSVLCPHI